MAATPPTEFIAKENNYSKVPIISITLRVVFVLARLTGDASCLLVFSVIISFG
jgi:hypothetical protein